MINLFFKIKHIFGYAKEVLTRKDFEYIIWYNSSNKSYGLRCACEKYQWESAMKWGASVADVMPYQEKVDLANLMTGILDGVHYSIAEDRKKEKQKKEGEKYNACLRYAVSYLGKNNSFVIYHRDDDHMVFYFFPACSSIYFAWILRGGFGFKQTAKPD